MLLADGCALRPEWNLYLCTLSQVVRISPDGYSKPFAGDGKEGFGGDGGPAIAAQLFGPDTMTFDKAGNAYISDFFECKIRRVDTKGVITTVVGDPRQKPGGIWTGTGKNAIEATIFPPRGLGFDSKGTLYFIAGNGIHSVEKDGILRTVIGRP